ncbi:MAG TPA: hypothetical protein VHO27_14970 [Angustibacter sp.]|nr:hypothetical protein [Angustibacter sp.]
MRRVFWIALGATAGVLVVRKLTKTAESYTPEGMAKGLAGLGEGLREMAQVVREAMDERDAELRLALGVDEGAIDPARAQALIDHPMDDHAWTSSDAGRASNPAHRAAGGRAR